MARAGARSKNVGFGWRRWLSSSAAAIEHESPAVVVQVQDERERFASLLRACAAQRSLSDGRAVHEQILRSAAAAADPFLANLVVDMYAKCGNLDAARGAFVAIRAKNIFSWTILLTAYAKSGHGRAVLHLLHVMALEGFKLEKVSSLALIDACAKLADLARARAAHARIAEAGLDSNTFVANAIVSMYGRCRDCRSARAAFDAIRDKTIVSWNALLGAYARNGLGRAALGVIKAMDLAGVPLDKITLIALVESYTLLGDLAESRLAYARIAASGMISDAALAALIVNMLGRSAGGLADAKRAFDAIADRSSVIAWNVLIAAHNHGGRAREALELFFQIEAPDKVSFLYALESCVMLGSLADGRDVHAAIARSAIAIDVALANAMVNMYGKCSSPSDARGVFDRMLARDAVSWNSIIASYARNGLGDDAIALFRAMALDGVGADHYSLMSALDACGSASRGLAMGRHIHARIEAAGWIADVALATALVKMYGRFGRAGDARRVFDAMPCRVALSWARMITAYAHAGDGAAAVAIYKAMDLAPDKVIFASVLDACAGSAELLEEGRRIHARIEAGAFEIDTVVHNALLELYGLRGCVDEARRVFDSIAPAARDAISWNSIIRAHLIADRPRDALRLFYEMIEGDRDEGDPIECDGDRGNGAPIERDRVSYVSALDACAAMGAPGLVHGQALHALILANRIHVDVYVGTALVTMYGRCGDVAAARAVFDDMATKNAVTWTSMIRGLSANGYAGDAVEVFHAMELEGCRADRIALVAVLDACRGGEDLGAKIHR